MIVLAQGLEDQWQIGEPLDMSIWWPWGGTRNIKNPDPIPVYCQVAGGECSSVPVDYVNTKGLMKGVMQ